MDKIERLKVSAKYMRFDVFSHITHYKKKGGFELKPSFIVRMKDKNTGETSDFISYGKNFLPLNDEWKTIQE